MRCPGAPDRQLHPAGINSGPPDSGRLSDPDGATGYRQSLVSTWARARHPRVGVGDRRWRAFLPIPSVIVHNRLTICAQPIAVRDQWAWRVLTEARVAADPELQRPQARQQNKVAGGPTVPVNPHNTWAESGASQTSVDKTGQQALLRNRQCDLHRFADVQISTRHESRRTQNRPAVAIRAPDGPVVEVLQAVGAEVQLIGRAMTGHHAA
jgi:hypothetical protein